MSTLNDPELRAFLMHGTRTGKLGFTAEDGRPLVTPVWFLVRGEGADAHLVLTTSLSSAKGRAIQRDVRLTLCVDREQPPYVFVQVQGRATISEDPVQLLDTATEIADRYMGPERADEFGRRNAVPGAAVVRIDPVRIRASLDQKADLSDEEN